MSRLVIGTRGSALALWQARFVQQALAAENTGLQVELEIIHTTGDRPAQTAPGPQNRRARSGNPTAYRAGAAQRGPIRETRR
ncbi:hypothetical protein LCGC14_1841250 [marine sediment metagenome]|uniref:Porphobilinogen deaminase N-terminal domain-containing protein n=1 Tax=marine sediment metagenome TaxID=412755 RepID=A0A0F9GDC7_9ZZZZ